MYLKLMIRGQVNATLFNMALVRRVDSLGDAGAVLRYFSDDMDEEVEQTVEEIDAGLRGEL